MSDLLNGPYCVLPDCHVWIAAENNDPAMTSGGIPLSPSALGCELSKGAPDVLLNSNDLRRWQKYRCSKKKAQFLQSRRAVQAVLEHELGEDRQRFVFGTETSGQPFVRATDGSQEKWISISHSDALTAVAYSWGSRPVGIDVETIRPLKTESLRNTFLTDAEKTWLCEKGWLDSEEAIRVLWTMKESVWKSTAGTPPISFSDISVALRHGQLITTLKLPLGVMHTFRTCLFGSEFSLDWPAASIIRLLPSSLTFHGCLALQETIPCKSFAD